jgi:ribosomal protein S18 acetylase RimI-like enzyme
MPFDLTDALIDDILFCMEDQKGEFYFDTVGGAVISGDDAGFGSPQDNAEGDSRYILLPSWDSQAGFRLMERFTASLKNAAARDELTAALDRGRGVFRAFKDALEGYPEVEKRWFTFKARKMRQDILIWYNALREKWGMERIGPEPEETGDLVLEDFRFRPVAAGDAPLLDALHSLTMRELGRPEPEAAIDWLSGPCLAAETSGGEFAGFIAAREFAVAGSAAAHLRAVHIAAFQVRPEYRGLGVGGELLRRFLETIDRNKTAEITIDLPVQAEGFARLLLREDFAPCQTRYRLSGT